MKYYAVKQGRSTGIFTSWDECKALVEGFSGAIYKSFKSEKEAQDYLSAPMESRKIHYGNTKKTTRPKPFLRIDKSRPYAFVDGSYNAATKIYGFGGFIRMGRQEIEIQGWDKDPDMVTMNNVAGEITGCMRAVSTAYQLGLKSLDIYYDYIGIEKWATGEWNRNREGTIAYHEIMQKYMKKMEIRFIKVKGHSGIEGNERADALAKKAVGIT